jgi:predicted alpha/beta-hydrolase family hydrolase
MSSFFRRRIQPVHAPGVPETIRRAWMCEVPTPPVRWRKAQAGTSVAVPAYARADLAEAYQHAP